MAMRTILVPVPDAAVNGAAVETALKVAKAVEGHVDGLYIENPPSTYARATPAVAYEGSSVGRGVLTAEQIEHQTMREAEERERKAGQAESEFRRLCSAHGVTVCGPDDFGTLPSASWDQTQGSYASTVTARAPAHDLMVVPNPSVAAPGREIAEHVLLDTGRPVLLAPARPDAEPFATAMIAWYPSLQAWRAVAAAVPLLAGAERVEIVTIGNDDRASASSRADVLRYLGWHGIEADARNVPAHGRAIGDALLAEASETGAGLLVMGAYSHSRLRELLLGGVTRHVLNTVAVTPVLMAH